MVPVCLEDFEDFLFDKISNADPKPAFQIPTFDSIWLKKKKALLGNKNLEFHLKRFQMVQFSRIKPTCVLEIINKPNSSQNSSKQAHPKEFQGSIQGWKSPFTGYLIISNDQKHMT